MITKDKLFEENKTLMERLSGFEERLRLLEHRVDILNKTNTELKIALKSSREQTKLSS